MRKFALMLMLALFAAASTIATVSVPTSFAQEDKDKKKKKSAKKSAKKKAAKKEDGGKAKKKGKAAPGKCGTGMYYDKKSKKCADAADKKK